MNKGEGGYPFGYPLIHDDRAFDAMSSIAWISWTGESHASNELYKRVSFKLP